jgi:hypothetical protein
MGLGTNSNGIDFSIAIFEMAPRDAGFEFRGQGMKDGATRAPRRWRAVLEL